MTPSQILTRMGYLLDDPDGDTYTSTVKLGSINTAYEVVCGVAHSGLLDNLHGSKDQKVAGTAGFTLPSDYLRYVSSKLRLTSPETWITKIDVDILAIKENNSFTSGTTLDPHCYIWSDTYVLIINSDDYNTNNASVRLFYIKKPTTVTASTGNFEINESLHEPMMKLALSDLKITYKYGDVQQSVKEYEDARKEVLTISQRYATGELT
ncbi:MAG: hypothetical protein KAS32_00940 [Candidatus Peribacteraceae bacterium]|nr:hypothetical protein [Candidatus Peribacteraceae bacterium]